MLQYICLCTLHVVYVWRNPPKRRQWKNRTYVHASHKRAINGIIVVATHTRRTRRSSSALRVHSRQYNSTQLKATQRNSTSLNSTPATAYQAGGKYSYEILTYHFLTNTQHVGTDSPVAPNIEALSHHSVAVKKSTKTS